MHFQFEVAQPNQPHNSEMQPGDPAATTFELLKQLLDVQREQLQLSRAMAAMHDTQARWRQVLSLDQRFPRLARSVQARPADA